jgi:hypothetical protein
VDDAEPAEDLHRARADVVAPHTRWFAGSPHLGNRHGNASLSEIHRQSEPDWAAASN